MPTLMKKFAQWCVIGAVLSALFACSSEKVNEPAKLEKLKPQITVLRSWKSSVGSGDEGLKLALSPYIQGNMIYTVDIEGELNALSKKTGKLLWQRQLTSRVSGGLGGDAERLFLTTFQGELITLDRQNGNEIWRRPLTTEAIAAPTSNGKIVSVQTIDGKLFVFDTTEGIQRWRYDSVGPVLSLRGTPSPLIFEDKVISSFANGEMIAFDANNGRPKWRASVGVPQGRTELERLIDADGSPLIADRTVYAVAYQGNLIAVDVSTGRELWSRRASSYTGAALRGERLYTSLANGDLVAFNAANSNEIWRNSKLKYRRLSQPVVFGDHIVVADLEGYLHFVSQQNGEILARVRPDNDGVMGNMLVSGSNLYVYTRSGDLIAYAIKSSSIRK